MNHRRAVMAVTSGILLIAAGFIFLMDQLGLAFLGALQSWYIVILALAACLSLVYALINRAYIYYFFTVLFSGIFLFFLIEETVEAIGYIHIWPIIPLSFGLGILLANLISRRRIGFLKSGVYFTVVSVALLIGASMQAWNVVLPVVIMLAGISLILNCFREIRRQKKAAEEQVYYVQPSASEPNDKNTDAKEDEDA